MITPLNYYANFVVGNSLTVNNTTPEITGGTPPPLPADGDLLIALIGTMGTRFGSPSNRAPQLSAYDGWEILSTIEVSGTAGLFQYTNTSYRLTVLTRPFAAGPWTFGASGAEQMTGVVIGFRGAEQAKNPTAVNLNAWVQSIDIPAHSDVPAGSYYLIAALHGRFEAQWYQAPNTLPAPYAQLANSFSTPQGSGLDPAMFLQGYESGGGAPAATTVWHWYPGVSAAIAFELTEITTLEYVGWEASDDLPTEDVTAPNFVRKALSITLPRPDLCPDDVTLTNPLAPSVPLYRGRPINPQVQGGQIRYELEGVEARWQRARPKKPIIQTGPLTIKQALEALLTARQAEFSFIRWNPIPEIYWPDGTIPQFPNLVISVDAEDVRRRTVYDEVVLILAVAPGYSLDFDAAHKLRVVMPPFAANALGAKTLTAADGNFEETGYITTDLVRSITVRSKPFEFRDSQEDAIQTTTARFADYTYQTAASDSAETTKGSISAGSSSLSVNSAIDFVVGNAIYIAGAGSSGGPLITTISAISGKTFTLAASASTTVSDALVRHAGIYPPIDDDLSTIDRDLIYAGGIVEDTFIVPFTPNVLVDYATFKVHLVISRWRYPERHGIPVPEQLSDIVDLDNPVPNDGVEHLIFDQANGTWIDFGVFYQGPVRVWAKQVAGGVQIRIQFTTYVDGFVSVGLGATGRRWFLGARFGISATSKRWQQGETEYSGQYTYEPGYSDLPDLDVSLLSVADNAILQTLARHIAEYKSRQATRYALRLSQPWALEPGDKGQRVNLPGGAQVIPDSYRLGINYGLVDVQAPFDVLAWKYEQVGFVLIDADGKAIIDTDLKGVLVR